VSADHLVSYGMPRRPTCVRITVYPGVDLPHVEIWGHEVRPDGVDVYPHLDLFRPQCAPAEWLEMFNSAEIFMFVPDDPPTLEELRKRAENMRGRIMLDRSRGVDTFAADLWTRFGWDVGSHAERLGIKHGSQAAARIFHIIGQGPGDEELAWFRAGFSYHRQGMPRPTVRGRRNDDHR